VRLSRRAHPQFRDKNRRDAGKSQPKSAAAHKMEAPRSPPAPCPPRTAAAPATRPTRARRCPGRPPPPHSPGAPPLRSACAKRLCLIEAPWMVNGGHGASLR
jgi:hypothetical protein